MLQVRIVFFRYSLVRITYGWIVLLLKFYTSLFGRGVNDEGPDRNPGLLKIQYPMKNRYTNGVRGS
jgi:hypothetical protein